MRWIASFLDAIFANVFADSKFFANLRGRFAGSVEELVYNVESGNVDTASLARTMERLIVWLPIVFIVCLLLDMFIRSRFVRYSYQDEYQAKKSVWWRWQSDADAALALESGAGSMQALGDGSLQEEKEAPMQEETLEEPAQQATEEAPEEAEVEAEDDLDRSHVTSARQNQVRSVAPGRERAQGMMTDLRDSWTIFKGALAFAPRTVKRNARLRKQSMQEEARHTKERMNERMQRGRAAKQRDETAQAEAMFDTRQQTYVDADFEANEPLNTGGIEGVDFAQAAQVMQAAVQEQQAQAEQEKQAAEPAEEQAE